MAIPEFSLAIKGALVYDGSGAPPIKADMGISGDTITHIGTIHSAKKIIDATGLAVAPGFIDTHGHSEFTMLAAPEAEGKLLQGITTEINGNCGLSAAPLLGAAKERREADQREYGINERWEGLEEYFGLLESRSPALNFATLLGHGNIRASVMGYEDRRPSGAELESMKALLVKAMNEGAMGMSSGLIYPPGIYSDIEELSALASAGMEVSPDSFIYTTHMRSEGEGLLDSIVETMEVGRRSGCRVHVSHIKTSGRANWPKAARAVELMETARASGLRVTCDRYPYIASATDLDAVFPAWMFEGGTEAELARLADPAVLADLRQASGAWSNEWGSIRVSDVTTEANKWVEGLPLTEIARRWNLDPFDALVRLLREERLRVGAIFSSMCDENLSAFLSLPYAMIGSDSSVRALAGITRRGRPHPRGFGSMPRFLRMCIDGAVPGVPTLEAAIGRITSLPARTFGLPGRGVLTVGATADITVFDPGLIRDVADYDDPFRPPVGVEHVIVNGQPAVLKGSVTGLRAGRVLRHGRHS